jgi:hypothetical protein
MITDEMLSNAKALHEKKHKLMKKLDTAPESRREALMHRIREIDDDISRSLGLSEADIAEINAETEAQVKAQIQREVEIGLALYQGAVRGDRASIEKLKAGSIEFASAIAERAITPEDLGKLQLADEFLSAGTKAMVSATKH